MEQSMIDELENIRSSSDSKNNYSSSLCCGSSDIIKSEIMKFEDPKEAGQSKLPSVVTFQTIEIERLNEEIQSLRAALKKYQKQVVNCQNYEVQIRELSEQCLNYDKEVEEYRQQIERLNMITQNLCQELQSQRAKHSSSCPSLQTKLNTKARSHEGPKGQLRKKQVRFKTAEIDQDSQVQDLRGSQTDRLATYQTSSRISHDRRALEEYVKRLEDKVNRYENDVSNFQIRSQGFLMDESQEGETDPRIARLTTEAARLNEMLRSKQDEIDLRIKNESKFKNKIVELQRQFDQARCELAKVPQLQSSARDWANKCSQFEGHVSRVQDSAARASNFEKNLEGANLQIQRLNWMVRSKINDLQQKDKWIQNLSATCEELKREESKLQSLYQRIHDLQTANRQMSEALRDRSMQIQLNKNESRRLENQVRMWEETEPRTKQIQQEYHRQIEQQKQYIEHLKEENKNIEKLQKQLDSQQNIKAVCMQEIEKLNETIDELKQMNQLSNQQCRSLHNQIDTLRGLNQTLNDCKDQNGRMSQQIGQLQQKVQEKSQMLDYLADSVLNLQHSLQECNQVETKLSQSVNERETIILELERCRAQGQQLEQQLLQANANAYQSECIATEIEEDRQMLHTTLNLQKQQIEHAKSQIDSLQTEVRQLHQVENQCQHAQEEANKLSSNCEDLSCQLQNEQARFQELSKVCEQLSTQIQEIKSRGYFPQEFRAVFADVKNTCQRKQHEIESLQKRQDQIDRALQNICMELVKGNNEIMGIQGSAWNSVISKVDQAIKHTLRIADLEQENFDLRLRNLQLDSDYTIASLDLHETNAQTVSCLSQNFKATLPEQQKVTALNNPLQTENPNQTAVQNTQKNKSKNLVDSFKPNTLVNQFKSKVSIDKNKPPTSVDINKPTQVDSFKPHALFETYKPPTSVDSYKSLAPVETLNTTSPVNTFKPTSPVNAFKPSRPVNPSKSPTPTTAFKGNFTYRC